MASKVKEFLFSPIDTSCLAFFRLAFGLMMFFGMVRFMSYGWVEELYIAPAYYFKYWGFSWIKTLPGLWMYLPFILLSVLALFIAFGFFYRTSTFFFAFLFSYVELLDKSNYLNHYYFISLVSFLMVFLPLADSYSVDAYRKPNQAKFTSPYWVLNALRLQVGLVYFFAGLAKFKTDWLVEALPLKLWLPLHSSLPLIGSLLKEPWVAYAMSWTGAFFDLTVPFFLLWGITRKYAYAALVVFHVFTWKIFNIGLFPWVMIISALVFFPPSWPKKLFRRFSNSEKASPETSSVGIQISPLARMGFLALTLYFSIQILMPLRHYLYAGNYLWTEEGYRFSWNVMLMEKNGTVEYRVKKEDGEWVVNPKDYLKPYQHKQMSTQPDMILAFAHFLKKRFQQEGAPAVEVYVDAMASLNGRKPQRLIDPQVDLASVKDSLAPKTWILPCAGEPGTVTVSQNSQESL